MADECKNTNRKLRSSAACRNTQMKERLIHFRFVFLSSANKCLLKVGAYCAQLEQYQKAIEIYEQVLLLFIYLFVFSLFFSFYNIGENWSPGWSQHDGQPAAEVQRQGVLLQSLPLPFHRGRAQREGEFFLFVLQFWDEENTVEVLLKTPPTLHRSRLKNTRRCSRRSRTPENANC